MNQRKMKSRKRLFLTLVLFDKKNFKENWHPLFKIMFPLKRKKILRVFDFIRKQKEKEIRRKNPYSKSLVRSEYCP
jgi:hypothetical protein